MLWRLIRMSGCGLGLLALFGGAGCPDDGAGMPPADPPVATVGERTILASELAAEITRFRREHGDLAFRSEDDRVQVRDQLLRDRIQELLLLGAARARKIEITEEAVDRAMMRLRAGYPERTFEEHLTEESIPESQVRRDLEERLMIRRLLTDEVNARVAVAEPEVRAYFAEHKKDLARPEEVRASQIVVRTQEEAERIRKDLLRGKNFAEMARKHSIAPEASRGGDLGFFARGVMPNPINATSFSLPPGRISEVIESPYGYHLFKVVEHRKSEAPELDDTLRAKIELLLRQAKEAEAQKVFITELEQRTQVTIHDQALAEVR